MIPVKTAIVGFGLSGKVFHSSFLHASTNFTIDTIVQQKLRSAVDVFPYVKLSSFDQVLSDDSIELVVVATPNVFHYEMTVRALEAGKHVIVEKPCASDSTEAKALVDCASKNEKYLFVFHNRRWDGDFMTVRQVLQSGMLGRIIDYEAHYDRYKPELNPKVWKEKPKPSITILHDLGTHIIDQAVALFGKPSDVTAKLTKQRHKSEIYDSFTLMLGYGTLQATLKASLLVREESPRYRVNGSQGSFVKFGIDPQEGDLQKGINPLDPDWGMENKAYWGTLNTESKGIQFRGVVKTIPGNYMAFYENVYNVIRNKAKMELPPNEAIMTPLIIDAALQSHDQGKTVTFDL